LGFIACDFISVFVQFFAHRRRPNIFAKDKIVAETVKFSVNPLCSSTRTSRNVRLVALWLPTDHPNAVHSPKWFKKERDPVTGQLMYRYTNEYWQCKRHQDWSRCPDIFL